MQQIFAGTARRFFIPVLAVLLTAAPALAGQLQWQALPDRERITITKAPNEGMAGPVGRIALTGVLVPFSEVPSGLRVAEPPAGARIFKGTRMEGRSLLIETQTPEFGFVVSKQTSSELVVDFFPNPLGARWKPSSKAPTTEFPPDLATAPVSAADEANRMLAADPQNTGQPVETSPAPTRPPLVSPFDSQPDNAGQALVPAQPATQSSAQPPVPAQPVAQALVPAQSPDAASAQSANSAAQPAPPAPVLSPGAPDQPKPMTVVLPGTPDHATTATRFAVAPDAGPSAPNAGGVAQTGQQGLSLPDPNAAGPGTAPDTPQYSASGSAGPPVPNPEVTRPFLDSRAQTAARSAPLPVPEPALPGSSPLQAAPLPAAPVQAPQPVVAAPVTQTSQPAPVQPQTAPVEAAPAQAAATPVPAVPAQVAAPAQPAAQPGAEPAPIPAGVGARTQGMVYGGTINTGGLDAIPPLTPPAQGQPQAGSEPQVQPPAAPQPPAQPQPAQTPPAAHGTGAAGQPPALPGATNATAVIYLDKDGNPVPAPADPKTMLPEIRQHISNSEFNLALDKAELLLRQGNIDQAEREELLHVRSEMIFVLSKDNLDKQYKKITDATMQAINFNQKSPRNAGALLRLGYMNLKLKNIPEAEARFNMLRRQFPDDENVPLTYYYWGDYHFQRNELQRAADEFQYLVQKYPNSRYAREGALGLARSFYRLGYYQQAFNVVDYIERRWARFYIEYPPFLNMMGDVAFRLNEFDYALKHYWLYVNLEPKGDEADIILTRIGDIYSMKGEKKAGREMYNESIRRFPDKDGALVAMMRLAENSMNDDPSIAGMFSVFDGPFSMAPVEVYRTIIEKHPQSSLVPLAKIKLAMWHLWKREFIETLDTTASFLQRYPEHELAPKAKEIALQTFAILSAESVADGRYGRMREIWERYPVVHGQEEILPPESRIALGVSYWKDGKPDDALKTIEPFFLGRKVPEYSEMALSLVLSIYLEHGQWKSIREVARRVDLWELSPASQQQLDYALALTAENLDEGETAVPIWQKLYDSGTLPPSQMAYAAFFLAREAEKQRELEKAYALGKEALTRLMEQAERSPSAADLGKIRTQLSSLIDVTETAGRLREALGFAEQYLQYVPAQDPERMAVQYRMARIYRKQGNLDAWKTTLTELAEKNPGTVYGQLAGSELKAAALAEEAARYSPTGRI